MNNKHIVIAGDTLSKIAKANGTTVEALAKINGIKDPNKISVGQVIYLDEASAFGFKPLFLDPARNAIEGLEYMLQFGGKRVEGTTDSAGRGQTIVTRSAEEIIETFVKRADGTWKKLSASASGLGMKLVTYLSPKIKVIAQSLREEEAKKNSGTGKPKPVHGSTPVPNRPASGPTATPAKSTKEQSAPWIVEGQTLDTSFLGTYIGGDLSKEEMDAAAKELKCEAGLIYAIARQESAHSSFVSINGRTVPTILYERHVFRRYTLPPKKPKEPQEPSPWEETHPDICGPAYHKSKTITKKSKDKAGKVVKTKEIIDLSTGEVADPNAIYGRPGSPQYIRLCRAYALDKDAALKAVSWGKFQIMGFNFKAAGFSTVGDFVKAMCKSDAEHIKAFLKFAKSNKTLLKGLQDKDFVMIAEGHNGASWKSINPNYASNIEKYYKEFNSAKK